jgi:hypothetical protein
MQSTLAAAAFFSREIRAIAYAPWSQVVRSRKSPAYPPLRGASASWLQVRRPRGKSLPPARPAVWRSFWGRVGGIAS